MSLGPISASPQVRKLAEEALPQTSQFEQHCVLQYVVEAFLKLARVISSDTLIDVGCNDGELQL